MWSRWTQYGLKYTTFINDGDSNAFTAVMALNEEQGPYNVPVIIGECFIPVSMHLGTKLKKESGENVTTRIGKRISSLGGAKKLTDDVILYLSQ